MAVKKANKREPRSGKHFVALIVGGNAWFHKVTSRACAGIGVKVRHAWLPAAGLERRAIPADIDVAIVIKDAAISRQTRESIAYSARKLGAWAIQSMPSHNEVIQALEQQGFVAEPLFLEEEAAPAAQLELPSAELAQEVTAEVAETVPETPAETPAPAAEATESPEKGMSTMKQVEILVKAGAMLKAKRISKGWKPADVAKKLGISAGYISSIETGKMAPAGRVCEALERLYGIPIGTLPRLASKENHRVKMPPDGPVGLEEAKETPKAAEPAPEPVSAPVAPPSAPLPGPPEVMATSVGIPSWSVGLSEREHFVLQVVRMQQAMKRLGIAHVVVTHEHFRIEDVKQEVAP